VAVSLSQSAILEAHRLMQAGRLQEALALAEPVVDKMHICDPAQGMVATIFLRLGRRADAELIIEKALQCEAGPADAYDALAHVCMLLGKHERSNALYRRAVELAPNDARLWYNLASSERSVGRLVEAEHACDRAIELDPKHYQTYLLRSELRVQSPESSHIAQLRAVLIRPGLDERARVPLGYALAKELDDLSRYDEAFLWFQEAASIRRRHLAYDVGVDERKLERIREVYAPELLRPANGNEGSCRYIFIIGLPRSGTTLLEHILMRLANVRSNGETDNFLRALLAASPSGPQDIFSRAAAAQPRAVAAHYARLADESFAGARIIEKLPMNYLYLGAIHRALPRAKLLLVRRSALDSCFAMYRTLFGSAYPFTYDFDDLARYYAAYDQLINHWRGSLGDALSEVEYEDLVKNPQEVGARVAQDCNLRWDPRAIEVDKGTAVSLTASAAQIRRPIYGSSSGRWRHYRKHLDALISALRRQRVALPDDA
jgi:tetratricopeptide (TPR) repeat protein